MNMQHKPLVNVFLSYDGKDEPALKELEVHLAMLKRQGIIATWYNRKIVPGSNRAEAIDEHIEQAALILLLISADFLASDDRYEVEMQRALARHDAGQAHVIPIILRECDWSNAPFAHLQVLPTDARPVMMWHNRDKAWFDVITGIRRVLNGASLQSSVSGSRSGAIVAPIWSMPFQRNPFFLGQDELLAELHLRLTRGTATALTQVQAISGLGGIGKTQIAIEYAYSYRDDYRYVFWIRSEHRDTIISDLVTLAGQLHLREQHETDQLKVVEAVKYWLDTHKGWLLLFDNADDISQLAPFLPGRHNGAILLTTRAAQTQPVAEPLQVELMDELRGAEFLLRRARILLPGKTLADMTPEDQQAACQLCQQVGGLPLALDQAGAYIDEIQCEVQDYLNFYLKDQSTRMRLLKRRGKVTAGHPDPVATTWSLAFIKVEQESPVAADLLRACAFLDPDLVQEDLLQKGAQFWGDGLANVAGDAFEWNETIGVLLKYALVRRSRKEKALSIHRLVQIVLKDAMDEPTQQQWARQTIKAVECVFPDGREAVNWATCKSLLPHAQICTALIKYYDLSSDEAAILLYRMANYLYEHARYSEAEPLYQQVLRIKEKGQGPDYPDMANSLNGLANLYLRQGKNVEAELFYQRALRIREQSQGPDHLDVAYSLNNLAILYSDEGKYAEAEPFYQRALHIIQQNQGPDHPDVANPLNGLANLYWRQGKNVEAEQLYQRALHIREQSQGPDHPDVAYPLNGLANLYKEQGKNAEAELLYQRALHIREQSQGPDHPLTQAMRKNYAILLRAMNRPAEADKLEGGL